MTAPFVFEQFESPGELVSPQLAPTSRAALIVAQAQTRALEIERDARDAGYQSGHAEALAAGEAERESTRAALAMALEGVYAARDELAAAVERRVVELALALAERIVATALEVQPELVCEVVASALQRALGRDRLVLDVNPEDVDTVRLWLAGAGEPGSEVEFIEVRPERRVSRGGCVVRTAEGEIDGQFTAQLERAGQVLRRALSEPAA